VQNETVAFEGAVQSRCWVDVQKVPISHFLKQQCLLFVFCLVFWVKEKSWINYSRSPTFICPWTEIFKRHLGCKNAFLQGTKVCLSSKDFYY